MLIVKVNVERTINAMIKEVAYFFTASPLSPNNT
jgi:hypothetical protein